MELSKEFRFEAAHRLTGVPDGHKCARLHGHSFVITVYIEGPVDPAAGWVMDLGDIKKVCQPVIDRLDHYYLNDIEGLENPTSEVLATWLWNCFQPGLPYLTAVVVQETCTSRVTYRGPGR